MKFCELATVAVAATAICVTAGPVPARGETVEQVSHYSIKGSSGVELYTSIGERGPLVGDKTRTIAHTNFKLTWSRQYVPKGSACTLVSARPRLVITYTLPKPSGKLAPALQKRWDVFYEGLRLHEKVHGDHIKEMLARIERTTIGVTVENDPKCTKIREQIKEPLSQASLEQRQKSRDFDRIEMGDGGNIQRLILDLVNGQ